MDLKQLTYFMHVAELGSFTRAAVRLGVAQPALSRQVRRLEVNLRQSLLVRNGRGATLTDAGRRLLEHARGIRYQVERAREDLEEMRGAPVGHAVIGVPPSVGRNFTASLVGEFRRQFPRATLRVVEGLSTYIMELMSSGRIDVGLVYNPPPSRAIETLPVASEELFLVGAAGGARKPARLGPPVPVRELERYPMIIPAQPHVVRMLLETHLAHSGGKLDVAWEVDVIPTIVELAARGFGHAVLPMNSVHNHPARHRLVLRPIVRPRLAIDLALVTSTHRPLTPLASRLAALARDLVARELSRQA